MIDPKKDAAQKINLLFESQSFAVLSTQKNLQPYASLVAFAATDNLKEIYFLTPNTTRKYDNLIENRKVAVLVNNIKNKTDDIYNAISVTGTGNASVVNPTNERQALDFYLKKHPHMEGFAKAPTTALIRVDMNRYFMVSQFQNVVELKVGS